MRRTLLVPVLAMLAVAAGCSSSKSVGTTGSTETPSSESGAVTSSTAAPTSTTAETTTTAAETTTTTAAPAPLVLRGDGIGAFSLGDDSTTALDGLIAQLGAPDSDTTVDYPVADGLGQYTTDDGEMGYVAPVGRSVCWRIGFCAEFGGATAASTSFTGWSYRDDTSGALESTSGVTIGTRWSDAPAIHVEEGGCYSVGGGDVDGIRLTLQSDGEPFGSFDESGSYIANLPPPAQVTVIWMEAGENPQFLYGDC